MKVSLLVMTLFLAVTTLASGCGGASDAEKQSNAGVDLQEKERYEEAIAEHDEAIRLDLQDALTYANRARAYLNLGELQRAIQDYDEAIRLDPELAKAYYNRGSVYDDLGQYQRAIEDLDEAIRLDLQDALTYANRARAYTLLGDDLKALQDVLHAVSNGFDANRLRAEIETLKAQR
jgi:tetratricopeptide (TPR) repeat protein